MKITICVLCFLCATTAAFSQSASVLNGTAQPIEMSGHYEHASEHPMALESSLVSNSSYSYAKGEVPLADLGSPIYEVPLGDIARAYRKERAATNAVAPKPVKVMEN